MENVVIKKIDKFADERGWLSEFWRNDELDYIPAMGYISVTKPGAIRGPHEHKFQTDFFIFAGPGNFELYLWDNRESSATNGEHLKIDAGENNPCLVIVPPGVVHGYKCISEKDACCINLPDKLYRGEGKTDEVDEIRWENRDDSPYKIY